MASDAGLEEIKCKLRQLMQEAQESGKLTKALGDIIVTKKQVAAKSPAGTQEMATIKAKLRELMTDATATGQLAQTLANISDGRADVVALAADSASPLDVDELKDKMSVVKQEMEMEMEALRQRNEEFLGDS